MKGLYLSLTIVFLFIGGANAQPVLNDSAQKYLAMLADTIRDKMPYIFKPNANFVDKKTIFSVTIMESGEIQKIEVKESSGNPDIDSSFSECITDSQPFANFPAGVKKESVEAQISFDCSLTPEKKLKCGVETSTPCAISFFK